MNGDYGISWAMLLLVRKVRTEGKVQSRTKPHGAPFPQGGQPDMPREAKWKKEMRG